LLARNSIRLESLRRCTLQQYTGGGGVQLLYSTEGRREYAAAATFDTLPHSLRGRKRKKKKKSKKKKKKKRERTSIATNPTFSRLPCSCSMQSSVMNREKEKKKHS